VIFNAQKEKQCETFLDPQFIKDLDDMREKCKSALPTNDRNSNSEQRVRPKSSVSSSTTRASPASKPSNTTMSRLKSSKNSKSVEQQSLSKKKTTTTNGAKHRSVTSIDDENDLDDAEENGIRLVDDEELDDDGKH